MADKVDTTAVGGMKISSRKLNDLEGAADSLFARALNLLPGDPKTFDDTVPPAGPVPRDQVEELRPGAARRHARRR